MHLTNGGQSASGNIQVKGSFILRLQGALAKAPLHVQFDIRLKPE